MQDSLIEFNGFVLQQQNIHIWMLIMWVFSDVQLAARKVLLPFFGMEISIRQLIAPVDVTIIEWTRFGGTSNGWDIPSTAVMLNVRMWRMRAN